MLAQASNSNSLAYSGTQQSQSKLYLRHTQYYQRFLLIFFFFFLSVAISSWAWSQDALPSWNEGSAKSAIKSFVEKVINPSSADFVPEEKRIVVFDNDGTLWAEQPIYFQFAFAIDRVKALAKKHPEWKKQEPFQSILAGDLKGVVASGEKGLGAIMAATHAGMTTEEFEKSVQEWIRTARHPRFHKPYTELVYQPMLELLAYLRAHGFKTYIVSGGGIEFMRVFSEKVYGIPPEQVVGSSGKLKFEIQNGEPVLVKLAEVDFVDDGPGKPSGIQKFIGRRPVMAFGNSDGDLQMLEWTSSGEGPRFGLIVHHTDSEREWAYDRQSSIGKLDKALDEVAQRQWIVVDMKKDWKKIFP